MTKSGFEIKIINHISKASTNVGKLLGAEYKTVIWLFVDQYDLTMGLPGCSVVKNLLANAKDSGKSHTYQLSNNSIGLLYKLQKSMNLHDGKNLLIWKCYYERVYGTGVKSVKSETKLAVFK